MRRILALCVLSAIATGCAGGTGPEAGDNSIDTPTSAPYEPVRPLPDAPPDTGTPGTVPTEESGYPVEPAEVAAALLTLADLPAGWTQIAEPASVDGEGVPRCLLEFSEEHRLEPDAYISKVAQGAHFAAPDQEVFLTSAVASYRDGAASLIEYGALTRDDVQQCLLAEFSAALSSNPDFASYELIDDDVRRLETVSAGAETHAVIYTATLAAGDSTLVVSSASAFARLGPLVVSVSVVGFGQFDTGFFMPAFETLLERVDAIS